MSFAASRVVDNKFSLLQNEKMFSNAHFLNLGPFTAKNPNYTPDSSGASRVYSMDPWITLFF